MKIKVIGGVVLLLVLAGIGWWLFGGQPRGQLGSVSPASAGSGRTTRS
jgi:hypothetical protein